MSAKSCPLVLFTPWWLAFAAAAAGPSNAMASSEEECTSADSEGSRLPHRAVTDGFIGLLRTSLLKGTKQSNSVPAQICSRVGAT